MAQFPALTRSRFVLTLSVLTLAMASLAAAAGELPRQQAPFSADSHFAAGGMAFDGKVWQQDGKRRQEMNMQGQNQVMIVRPDLGVMYMMMPGSGVAMEMALMPEMEAIGYEQIKGLNPEPVAEETVSGVETTKYRIDGSDGAGGQMTGHSWITEDGIVVKMESQFTVEGVPQRVSFLLQNIQRGPQDPALFELPAGLQVMKMQ